jgi:hypothetical protein
MCLEVLLRQAVIPPGGEGEVEVVLDATSKRGAQSDVVKIHSNDPEHPTSYLQIKAVIEDKFDFLVPDLTLGGVAAGDTAREVCVLSVNDTVTVKITDITSSSPRVTVRRLDTSPLNSEDRYALEVVVHPDPRSTWLAETVTVHSNLESKPQATLRISTLVLLAIDRFAGSQQDLPQTITIINNRHRWPLVLGKVRDDQGLLSFDVKAVFPSRKYEVTALLPADAIRKLITVQRNAVEVHGKIVITTDDADQGELSLDYTVLGR